MILPSPGAPGRSARAQPSRLGFVRRALGFAGRLALGCAVLLLAVAGAGWMFLRASLPAVSGRQTLAGLTGPVTVWRDRWGVPAIRAASAEDGIRALGFVHASERLWQMELRRRAATGTLSEVLGPATLALDEENRRCGLGWLGRRDFERAPETVRRIARAYTDGINAWIARHRWALPPEFLLLRFRPRPWTPEECFAFARLMMLNLTESRDFELARYDRFRLLGPLRAVDLIRLEPGGPDEPFLPKEIDVYYHPAVGNRPRASSGGGPLLPFPGAGSNAFAIGGSLTGSGRPILASDPHLPVEMPGVWYEAALLSPEIEARGLTLAGLPGIVMGRNRHVAWGITVHQADDTDLFVERVDTRSSPPRVARAEGWSPLRRRVEEIPVRGAAAVPVELLDSDRGYLLPGGSESGRPSFSVACAALEGDNPIPVFWSLLAARDAEEFLDTLHGFRGTPLNFTFADEAGTIGSHAAGFVPRRRGGDGRLPTPGWSAAYGWDGSVPFDALPGAIRWARVPDARESAAAMGSASDGFPKAFSVTANNRPFGGPGPDPYPGEWAPPFRAERIAERLAEEDRWSIEEAATLQNDVESGFARRLVTAVETILSGRPSGRPLREGARRALEALDAWDFRMERRGPARLFAETTRALVEAVAGDDVRAAGSGPVLSPWGLLGILEGRAREDWFDDVGTPVRETPWETVARGLATGWERTTTGAGDSADGWNWAAAHRVTFEHPLGRPTHLSRWLDAGPVGMPGDSDTVNAQAWSIRDPFRVRLVPSARQVIDLADPDRSVAVIVPGQSGHPLSSHFSDQLRLWANGGTRPAPFSESALKAAAVERLDLVPDREFR